MRYRSEGPSCHPELIGMQCPEHEPQLIWSDPDIWAFDAYLKFEQDLLSGSARMQRPTKAKEAWQILL